MGHEHEHEHNHDLHLLGIMRRALSGMKWHNQSKHVNARGFRSTKAYADGRQKTGKRKKKK